MHIGDRVAFSSSGRRARVVRVFRAGEKLIQRKQLSLLMAGVALGIDLLQAKNVGIEPFECGPQHFRTQIERHLGLRRQIQAFQIEGRQSHAALFR